MVEVSPSILDASLKQAEELKGLVSRMHIDVMDGLFVEQNTLKKFDAKKISAWNAFEKDVHLMVEKPEKFISKYSKNNRLIWFHVEATKKPFEVIEKINEKKMLAGIAVKPSTPLKDFAFLLNYVDSVLVMTVEPGKGGQKFIPKMLEKIFLIRSVFSREICVDGGINPLTAKQAVKAGASCIVAGSFIFKGNAVKNTKKLLIT
ncbi:ribulose-phosphate 3-epimerase [Candidatus Micrarchaeota archaeon]|nr:ribulose-phosphate 3-epimerase [Candidatus Micrarchaeota archaeon]